MKSTTISVDGGSAYGRPTPTHNAVLTEVGRGTPMGELMRRYWQPIGLAAYAGELPRQIRALGEDLIVFRDKQGRPGLVHPRCAHRGSSLLYARVDAHGLRCCYHGWAFDVQGHCTDQPCEPNNGERRGKMRQPWYPVEERYGMLFAYMGPPEKKPLLPRYDMFETIPEGERLFTDDHNIGSGRYFDGVVPFNWLQHYENIHDTGHFLWLHFFHSGPQFGSRYGELDKLDFQPWEWMKNLSSRATRYGILSERTQALPDGRTLRDQQHAADPHYTQRFPGDWEAQGSQGPISLHSEEHLVTSDRGIAMLRRQLKQQVDLVAAGKDPLGVAFEAGRELVVAEAGQYLSGAARTAE